MCRSIKQLRRPARDVEEAEIQAAALQFVRKVSGYRQPARANAAAFDAAVSEVANATRRLLAEIGALAVVTKTSEVARPMARPSPLPLGEG